MFYSEDFRMTKSGGMGIIWLAATLGPRSKRVTKRQILACDVVATCERIIDPVEPLALRTSAGLLVGVVRVYDNKVEILHKDVETLESTVRKASMDLAVGTVNLDLGGGGKARHDQITLPGAAAGDSAIDLDFGLSAIDWQNFLKENAPGRQQRRSESREGTAETEQGSDQHEGRTGSKDTRMDTDEVDISRRRAPSLGSKGSVLGSGEDVFGHKSSQDPYGGPDLDLGLGEEGLGLDFGDNLGGGFSSSGFAGDGMDMNMGQEMDFGAGMQYDGEGMPGDQFNARSPAQKQPSDVFGSTQGGNTESEKQDEVPDGAQPGKRKRATKTKKLPKDKATEMQEDLLRQQRSQYGAQMDKQRQEMFDKEEEKLQLANVRHGIDTMLISFPFSAPPICSFLAEAARSVHDGGAKKQVVGGVKRRAGVKQTDNFEQGNQGDGFGGMDFEMNGMDGAGYQEQGYEGFDYQGEGYGGDGMQHTDMGRSSEGIEQFRKGNTRASETGSRLPWDSQSRKESEVGPFGDGGFGASSDFGGIPAVPVPGTPSTMGAESLLGGKTLGRHRSSSIGPNRQSLVDPANLASGPASLAGVRAALPWDALDETMQDFCIWAARLIDEKGVEEDRSIEFDELVPVHGPKLADAFKRTIAAAAFYNCLTLATKTAIQVAQTISYGPITITL